MIMNFFSKFLAKESPKEIPPTPETHLQGEEDKSIISQQNSEALCHKFSLQPGLQVAQKTDVGLQREQNEDTLYTFKTCIQSNDGLKLVGLFIIADGTGGFQDGEIASATAVRIAAEYILKHAYLPSLTQDSATETDITLLEVVKSAILAANQAVMDLVPQGGTTLTIALVVGFETYIAHVGDSRVYVYQSEALTQLTKDHSLVARLIELGQASSEETPTHPQKNVLYRAVGQFADLEVATYTHTLSPGSYLLMCSDGLWNLVSDQEISHTLASSASLLQAVNTLVQTAKTLGGNDNITVILVTSN